MGHFFKKVVFLGIYLYLVWWNLEKIRWGRRGSNWVAIVVYIGFRYNAPTQFRYIHIYIHQI